MNRPFNSTIRSGSLVSAGALSQNPLNKKITLGPATVELALKNQIYLQHGV